MPRADETSMTSARTSRTSRIGFNNAEKTNSCCVGGNISNHSRSLRVSCARNCVRLAPGVVVKFVARRTAAVLRRRSGKV